MKTIGLDKNTWDIEIKNGGMTVLSNIDALKQFIKQRILVWQGEYFLDIFRGINYSEILGSKKQPEESEFINMIESIGYGLTVTEFTMSLDSTRTLNIRFSAESIFGRIESFNPFL